MKRILKRFQIILVVLIITLTTPSCIEDFLDIDPISPKISTEFSQDEVFAKIYATLALTGNKGPDGAGDVIGIDEGTSSFVRLIWNLNEITTDEAMCSWGDPGIPELNFNNWSASHSNIRGLWGRLYFNITLINSFLESTAGMDDAKTKRQQAEARFIRALNYYYLMDLFGNVVFTDKVGEKTVQVSRTTIFNYINKELNDCENDMYAPNESKPYYRVNKVANWLLRSRIYLNAKVYTTVEKWDSAAIYAQKVIDPSSGYSLCPTFRHLFMADNAGVLDGSTVNKAPNEIIMAIPADGVQTKSWGTSLFLIASTHTGDMPGWGTTEGWGGNRARATLVKKFFPGSAVFSDPNDLTTAKVPTLSVKDARALFLKGGVIIKTKDGTKDSINTKLRTLGIVSNTFLNGYSVIKFSNLRADGLKTNDIKFTDTDVPLLRQAEAYLTYAEAVFRGAQPINGMTALNAMNTLRARAGKTTNLTTLTEQDIIDEWAREFFFEGRRRTDLVRFGHYGGDTNYKWDWKNGVSEGANFDKDLNIFPIPDTELSSNNNVTQNPGY